MLSIFIFLPIFAGVFARFFKNNHLKVYSILCSLMIFIISIYLYIKANNYEEFVAYITLIPSLGVHYYVGVDGINSLFNMLVCFMVFIYFVSLKPQNSTTISAIFISLGFAVLIFSSRDIALFWVFWEIFFIFIMFFGLKIDTKKAFYRFLIFDILSALCMFCAIWIVEIYIYEVAESFNFTYEAFESVFNISTTHRFLCFLLFFIALIVKNILLGSHLVLFDNKTQNAKKFRLFGRGSLDSQIVLSFVFLLSLKITFFSFYMFGLGLFKMPILQGYDFIFGLILCICFGFCFLLFKTKNIKTFVFYSFLIYLCVILFGMFSLDELGVSSAVFYFIIQSLVSWGLVILCDGFYLINKTHSINEISKIEKTTFIFFIFFMSINAFMPFLLWFFGDFMIVFIRLYNRSVIFGVGIVLVMFFHFICSLNMIKNIFFKNKIQKIKTLSIDFIIGISVSLFVVFCLFWFLDYVLDGIKTYINHPLHYKQINDIL